VPRVSAHVHDWQVVGAVFSADAQVESTCVCGATAVETSVTLNPGINEPGLEDQFLYDDPELRPSGTPVTGDR
jgi:hypothetical protein